MHDHAVHRDLDAIGFGCQASPEAYDWCPTLPLYTIVEHHVIFFTVLFRSFRQLGVPYFGVLRIRILLFGVLSSGPLILETPILSSLPCYLAPLEQRTLNPKP